MTISLDNVIIATRIFTAIFVIVLLLSFRKKKELGVFSLAVTQELKGLAILAIIFGHVGYFLAVDHRFLFPLSIAAGVGVNLFLFLSGYGLTMSALVKNLSPWQFYRRRLGKLYQPLWLVLLLFLGLDLVLTGKTYSLIYIFRSFLGFFPRADLFTDINSPLWYLSLIIAYYLLFPLIFWRKFPYLSAVILYLAGFFLIRYEPVFLEPVLRLYRVHILAFPLGLAFAALSVDYRNSRWPSFFRDLWQRRPSLKVFFSYAYWPAFILLSAFIAYTAYYSRVGGIRWQEEIFSLLTAGAFILLFLIKKTESRLFYYFGLFSYEIYLLHWPIMSRFDVLFCFLPAWLAMSVYLVFFLAAAWLLRFIIQKIDLKN
jgi:peptidoglycan/LPS O-acetylase OafA/YrhL